MAGHLLRGHREVHKTVPGGQTGGVGGLLFVLGDALQGPGQQLHKVLSYQLSTQSRQPVREISPVCTLPNGIGLRSQHRSGVEALCHAHQGHPGKGVACADGRSHGRRTAPARQK